ncbi:MAG: peptidyl-prolyl cis-trans isomerase D [Gammaproteobacteria bacterium]|jgi:peptidyl-prolyl cis-trans isomerase D
MLQLIRDRATGWIAWVIIGLICITFALVGANSYLEPDQGIVVASVDDSEISYYEYRDAVQQQIAQLRQMFGGNVSQEFLDNPELRAQVLDNLVDAEAVLQRAVSSGLRVSDDQVATAIRSMQVFQDSGSFSSDRYNAVLRSQGISSPGFELDLRRNMLGGQVRAALSNTAIVTTAEVERSLRRQNEQRKVRLVTIDPATMQIGEPDEARIKTWYDDNKERYVQAEQVSIRYIELSRQLLADSVPADDVELRAIYEQRVQQGNFGLTEQRDARHILIEVGENASQDAVAAAQTALDAARKRIADGESFDSVAEDVSQDVGSASLGGQLGQFGRGVMEAAFEDVAFALSIGELSEPVRTRFGWHLIEVTAIQPARVRSFEDARDDLLRAHQLSQAEELFADQAERLATLGFENPDSLVIAAETVGLPVKDSVFFTRRGELAEGMLANPAVREAAFNPDVLEAGNNSDLIEVDEERRVMVRIAERKPERQKMLDEVRDDIVNAIKLDSAAKMAGELGELILTKLRDGTALDELAQEHAGKFADSQAVQALLAWGDSKTLMRDLPAGVPSSVAALAFRMPAQSEGKLVYAGTSLVSGAYAVVELSEVSQAPMADESKAKLQRERVARELAASKGAQTFTAVQKALRRQSDVIINRQNLRANES